MTGFFEGLLARERWRASDLTPRVPALFEPEAPGRAANLAGSLAGTWLDTEVTPTAQVRQTAPQTPRPSDAATASGALPLRASLVPVAEELVEPPITATLRAPISTVRGSQLARPVATPVTTPDAPTTTSTAGPESTRGLRETAATPLQEPPVRARTMPEPASSRVGITPSDPARATQRDGREVDPGHDRGRPGVLRPMPLPVPATGPESGPVAPPNVQVSIGRVEIRAVPAAVAHPERRRTRSPATTLDDYLIERNRRGTS